MIYMVGMRGTKRLHQGHHYFYKEGSTWKLTL